MRPQRTALLSILLISWAGFLSHAPPALLAPDKQIKSIRVAPLPSQKKQLRLLRSFPQETDESRGVFLTRAHRFSVDGQGRSTVTDQGACKIFIFDQDGELFRVFGGCGQGPGDFHFAGRAFFEGVQWIALDVGNARLQFFDEKGRFVNSSRLARNYDDMAIGNDGTVYAFTMKALSADLIDALDPRGKKLFSFGELPAIVKKQGIIPRFFLDMGPKNELFAAYWFAPVVQVYTAGGELSTTFEIRYQPMMDKFSSNPSGDEIVPGGARRLGQSIIEAIEVTEAGFFLLHRNAQGQVDILEFRRDGTFVRDYWAVPSADYFPIEMAVHVDQGKKQFFLLQASPDNRIDIFVEK